MYNLKTNNDFVIDKSYNINNKHVTLYVSERTKKGKQSF